MKTELRVYPTSRALRAVSEVLKREEGFLPTLMRMDEFEQRAVLVEGRAQIDPLQRILLLREAAAFESFEGLKVSRELIRFFGKSEVIFKFFEELAVEKVDFQTLVEADAYVEFETHLAILEQLLENYRKLLEQRALTDKAFIPERYRLNEGFLRSYRSIEIYLEGYLSRYELELLEYAAQQTRLIIHYHTSRFNRKMQERFSDYGMKLPEEGHCTFDFTDKRILSQSHEQKSIDAEVYAVEERGEQVAMAFVEIEKMVRSGIDPEKIVLLLPDESFKTHFMLFDQHHNLNFAMGYDYRQGRIYKSLEALYLYWQTFERRERLILERYGVNLEMVERIKPEERSGVEEFFTLLQKMELLATSLEGKGQREESVYESYLHFLKIFEKECLSLKEWMFLWLHALSKITLDDVHGGLVTVMGVLETRGVDFEGVVIVDFNENVVPTSPGKDQFLNTSVRAFAGLPTKHDRESLQKQYYKRLLEQASRTVILYCTSDNTLPSKFLYELGLDHAVEVSADYRLLYGQTSRLSEADDPIVDNFDARKIEWSASRLKTYLECRRKYYYRYVRKIQAKQEEELNEVIRKAQEQAEQIHKSLEAGE